MRRGGEHGQVRPHAERPRRRRRAGRCVWLYNRDLFDAATVAPSGRPLRDSARGGRWRTRSGALSALPLLAAAERQQLRGVERHGRGLTRSDRLPARADRGAGGAHARGRGRGLRGRGADLPRARRARPTGWRAGCGGWASGRRCRSASAPSARWRWWWPCSPSSRRAAPTCRSIPPIRRTGWPTCWRTRGVPGAADPGAAARSGCRRTAPRWSCSTARPSGGAPSSPRAAAPARQPGLRDLHLGLDGPAQGGDEHPPGHRQPPALDAGGVRPRRPRTGCSRRPRSASTSRSGNSSGR